MNEYTPRDFLRDRRPYIVLYAAFGLVTVAVVQLDLWLQGASLQFANVAYVVLLGLVGLAAFLVYDWRRQAPFYRRLTRINGADALDGPYISARAGALSAAARDTDGTDAVARDGKPEPGDVSGRGDAEWLDAMSVLDTPVTIEQQVYAEAWATLYGRLRTELAEEQNHNQRRLRFLSQWAHHMKTPVAVIDLELQKARRPGAGDAPEHADGLERLARSVAKENERIKQALQGLLNAVRLDEFTSDFRPEPVHLPGLVRQVINDYRHAFITHGVYPKIEHPVSAGPAETLTVYSDAKWLRLVLEQIISNAVKYSASTQRDIKSGRDREADDREAGVGEGANRGKGDGRTRSGQVVVRFARENGDTVLEIEDNGIGIPPEDLGRVFDPFFTGSAGRTHAASTGLGLYLARETCRRLGHPLSIRSAPGDGTTVRIRFAADTSIFAGVRAGLSDANVTRL